jgi:hypothetical protein
MKRREILVRSPIRRRCAALAALSAGILITVGCGQAVTDKQASDTEELFFQPATVQGPDPFTESTAVAPTGPSVRPRAVAGSDDTARAVRSLPGSTPGLYGGAQSLSSCDVERQVRLLTEDRAKARAFARGAGIGQASVPTFLRGLTPVVLQADTRMTNGGYRSGSVTSFQSVLQAGTAVMVDDHGMPRVRCACGNPLRPAVAAQDGVVGRGRQWPGYRPDRVVVIKRTARVVDSLIIVDVVNNTWVERRTGTYGDEDGPPGVMPPYSPDADITDPNMVQPSEPPAPEDSQQASADETATAPEAESVPPSDSASDPNEAPVSPDAPFEVPSDEISPDLPPGDETEPVPPGDGGGTTPGDQLSPPMPDAEQTSIELIGPDTPQG